MDRPHRTKGSSLARDIVRSAVLLLRLQCSIGYAKEASVAGQQPSTAWAEGRRRHKGRACPLGTTFARRAGFVGKLALHLQNAATATESAGVATGPAPDRQSGSPSVISAGSRSPAAAASTIDQPQRADIALPAPVSTSDGSESATQDNWWRRPASGISQIVGPLA